jgi:hypothetical protein
MTDLGRLCTWDQNDGLGTNMYLGPNHTWDQITLGTNMHLGPNHTWDQYAVGTNMHLRSKCTNMHLKCTESVYNN